MAHLDVVAVVLIDVVVEEVEVAEAEEVEEAVKSLSQQQILMHNWMPTNLGYIYNIIY